LHIHPRKFAAVLVALFLTTAALAEGTRTWEQSKFEDLSKGTATGVAIHSTGGLELAPAFKSIYTAPSTYIWSIASDDAGNIYAAAGSPARVYRVTPDGQATIIFEPTELQVQALVVDNNGSVYAGTAPDGKVYKLERKGAAKTDSRTAVDKSKPQLDPSWTSSVYFDPRTKYIWDLALDNSGDLFVATGDRGEIYRVTPKGDSHRHPLPRLFIFRKMFGTDLMFMPMHPCQSWFKNLHPVHTHIPGACIGVLCMDDGESDKRSAILGPAGYDRQTPDIRFFKNHLLAFPPPASYFWHPAGKLSKPGKKL